MATSDHELQQLINITSSTLGKVGLRLNHSKSVVMGCQETITSGDTYLQNVQCFKYLGVDIHSDGTTESDPLLYQPLLTKLLRARLKPGQKLYFLRSHLIPTYIHRHLHEDFTGTTLDIMDRNIRAVVKTFLAQVPGIPNPCIHLKVKNGGLGVPQLRWFIPNLAFKRMRKLCISRCPCIRFLTSTDEFKREMTRISILTPAKLDYDLRLLRDISTNPGNRGFLCFSIGGNIVNRHLAGWTNIPSHKLISLIRLRSGTLGAIHGAPNQPTCHRCKRDTPESLFHILNQCPETNGLQTLRHDKVRDMVHDTMVEKGWTVLREVRIPISRDNHVRPDLIAIHPTLPKAFVLDVRISYELDKDSLLRKDLEKRAKYQENNTPILDYTRVNFPDIHQLQYYGLIFGSRGSIHCVTLNLLKNTFGFSDLRLSAIIDKVIHESLSIYGLFNSDRETQREGASVPG